MTNRRTRDQISRLCARLRRTAEFRAARVTRRHSIKTNAPEQQAAPSHLTPAASRK